MQQKVDLVIGEEYDFPATITKFQPNEMKKMTYSTIFLHLSRSVTRECGDSKDPAVVWKKLDEFFLTKTLPNKIYLLKQIFAFKMDPNTELQDNLDMFNKLVQDLASCSIKFSDEQLAVILLNSLLDCFESLINAIEYERDALVHFVFTHTSS